MQGNSTFQNTKKPRILVAPLDWGLGHATRCIPIISTLLQHGCEVLLAAEGKQERLLRYEFPDLAILPLQGYKVEYGKTKTGLFWKMLIQLPGLIRKIQKEHKWLQTIVDEYKIDAVISDNRYGLYHKNIPSVFITHQLQIKTGLGKWADKVLQKKNYKFINRFTECWVPDNKENGLAGELSHPEKLPKTPIHYIGSLSRFRIHEIAVVSNHLLILLSGPEPQRSLLEEKIIKEISHYSGIATIVRGMPGEEKIIPSTNMIKFYNHLPSDELNKEMLKAEFVIARSGYSTVMDIAALNKKCILIPTPGQTEQEYLGEYLQQKQFSYTVSQGKFDLNNVLQNAMAFNYKDFLVLEVNFLKQQVKLLLEHL